MGARDLSLDERLCQVLPSLSSLIQREELLMQICISSVSVQLFVALISPELERTSMWSATQELSCELLSKSERSPRFTLIPASEDR